MPAAGGKFWRIRKSFAQKTHPRMHPEPCFQCKTVSKSSKKFPKKKSVKKFGKKKIFRFWETRRAHLQIKIFFTCALSNAKVIEV